MVEWWSTVLGIAGSNLYSFDCVTLGRPVEVLCSTGWRFRSANLVWSILGPVIMWWKYYNLYDIQLGFLTATGYHFYPDTSKPQS